MTEKTEFFDEEEKMFLEVFPYPKWVRLFNYFFPKTEGYKSINWRKHLKTWSRWAPWLTMFLLLGILVFSAIVREGLGLFAAILFIPCFLRFLYLLVLALIAKCLRRSPITPLSLMPLPPLCAVGILSICFLFCSIFADGSDSSEKQKKTVSMMQKPFKTEIVNEEKMEESIPVKKSQTLKQVESSSKYEHVSL